MNSSRNNPNLRRHPGAGDHAADGGGDAGRDVNDVPPGKPTEETMLAWIDGDLPAESVARLSSIYPELALQVSKMRADAAVIAGLPHEQAPADLLSRVGAQLGTSSLRLARTAIEHAESDDDRLRGMRTHQVEVRRRISWAPYRYGLAAAAAIALLVGGTLLVSDLAGRARSSGTNGAAIALNQNKLDAEHLSAAESTSNRGSAPVTVANAADVAPINSSQPAAQKIEQEITVAQALDLAREGRLVVRVYANDTRLLAKAESGRRGDGATSYRLSKTVPSRVIAAVASPSMVPAFAPTIHATDSREIAAASHSRSGQAPRAGMIATTAPAELDLPAPKSITYLADLRGGEDSLADMRERLELNLKGTAEFEVLQDALPMQLPMDPASVLWWTQGPDEWSGRYVVPVVIEPR